MGVALDVGLAACETARTIICEVMPTMPRTLGTGFLHIDDIDCFVESAYGPIEHGQGAADAISDQIADYIADLILMAQRSKQVSGYSRRCHGEDGHEERPRNAYRNVLRWHYPARSKRQPELQEENASSGQGRLHVRHWHPKAVRLHRQ